MRFRALEGEREFGSISQVQLPPWKRGAVVVLILVVIGFIAFNAYRQSIAAKTAAAEQAQEEEKRRRSVTIAADLPIPEFGEFPAEVEVAEEQDEPEARAEPEVIVKTVYIDPTPKQSFDPSASGSTLIDATSYSYDHSDSVEAAATQSGDVAQGGALMEASGQQDQGAVMPVGMARATRMSDRSTKLTQGSTISCNLSKSIITEYAGHVSCETMAPIYSADGSRLLIPPTSTAVGTYASAVGQGIRRIGVQWHRIETPSGDVINIDSPATGPLGSTGIDAGVDTHFWDRFGGAILVSLIDVAIDELTDSAETTGEVVFAGSARAGASLAEEVLRNSINIKPTRYANIGDEVAIVVTNQDWDFSEVVYDRH